MKSYSTKQDKKLNYNNKDPFDVVASMASRIPFQDISLHLV